MREALDRFLYESQIAARITLNGERLPSKSVNPGKHIRDLEVDGVTFARVYVNKSAKVARVIVRVNGVAMFTNSTNAKAQVIIELEPALSREALTANRDGLHWRHRESLDGYLRELAVDTNSALRSRRGLKTTIVEGGGMKSIGGGRKNRTANKKLSAAKTTRAADASIEYQPAALYNVPVAAPTVIDGYDQYTQTAIAEQTDDFDAWLHRTFGDIFIFDEVENSAVRKVLPFYLPGNWKEVETSIGDRTDGANGLECTQRTRKHRKGGNIIRVLLLWQTAIQYALEIGLDIFGRDTIKYAVGFVFPTNDETAADCRRHGDGYVFSLCPVDANGKLKFAVTERSSLKTLMAYAQHEVVHTEVSWHGEEFSTKREQIAAGFDDMECLRRMKRALRDAKI